MGVCGYRGRNVGGQRRDFGDLAQLIVDARGQVKIPRVACLVVVSNTYPMAQKLPRPLPIN